MVTDSGNIFDSTLKGGRLGFFCFSQEQIIWSDMSYKCNEKLPQEVYDELSPENQDKVPTLDFESDFEFCSGRG